MTKLEQLFNEYYSTEDLTLKQHLNIWEEELSSLEIKESMFNLVSWLNSKLEEAE